MYGVRLRVHLHAGTYNKGGGVGTEIVAHERGSVKENKHRRVVLQPVL